MKLKPEHNPLPIGYSAHEKHKDLHIEKLRNIYNSYIKRIHILLMEEATTWSLKTTHIQSGYHRISFKGN